MWVVIWLLQFLYLSFLLTLLQHGSFVGHVRRICSSLGFSQAAEPSGNGQLLWCGSFMGYSEYHSLHSPPCVFSMGCSSPCVFSMLQCLEDLMPLYFHFSVHQAVSHTSFLTPHWLFSVLAFLKHICMEQAPPSLTGLAVSYSNQGDHPCSFPSYQNLVTHTQWSKTEGKSIKECKIWPQIQQSILCCFLLQLTSLFLSMSVQLQ